MAFPFLRPSPRSWSRSLPLLASACLLLAVACGDDGGSETGAETGPSGSSSGGEEGSTSSGSTGSVVDEGSSTAMGSESSGDGSSTGAPTEDPSYPRPEGGCPGGTVPVTLPGAELCAPMCTGADDACRMPATGDAVPQCTPFLGAGGSGDPCDAMTPCGAPEVCGPEGSCGEVAFWACQLACDAGQSCPDGMSCSGFGTCGY